jgi:hypothetical protein
MGSSTPGAIEMRNPKGASIVIDKDGKITLIPAPGQDIVLAGGTLNVARKTDQVQVVLPANSLTIAAGTNSNALTLTGTITGAGAPNVKG